MSYSPRPSFRRRAFDRYSNQVDGWGSGDSMGARGSISSKAMARRLKGSERRARLSLVLEMNDAPELPTVYDDPQLSDVSESSSLLPDNNNTRSAPNKIPISTALRSIILEKYVSVLLLLIPFAVWAHVGGWNAQYIFWLNFLVMIPLAAILGDFTEEAALHTNETVGGLLNATFGNAVEVVVAIQALLADEIRVVQGSMLGSIFSNLLLVLGCCFFFGGLKYKEQSFNSTNASANIGLLALSSIALVLPTPYAAYYEIHDEGVLNISRYAAIFLLFMYVQLLIFQLYTHADLIDSPEEDDDDDDDDKEDEGEEEEEASIPLSVALIGLFLTTLTVTLFSNFLVESIDEFCEGSSMSKTFVGLILLPIVGNAVEHITAVTVAMKDKMDLSIGGKLFIRLCWVTFYAELRTQPLPTFFRSIVAVGSCTQISLFVVPVTVLVGWAMDKDMTLNFPHFEITLYVLSIFTVSICTLDGKSNWLLGSLLITTYVLIAIGFWYEDVVAY
jgi:Ca2+:H+ antiporter